MTQLKQGLKPSYPLFLNTLPVAAGAAAVAGPAAAFSFPPPAAFFVAATPFLIVLITPPLFVPAAVPGLVPVAVAGRCLLAATNDPLLASLDTLAPLILRDVRVVAEAVDVVAALALDFAALACVASVIVDCF